MAYFNRDGFLRWLNGLNEMPTCPTCKGTGKDTGKIYHEIVWWKGKQERVCGRCHGRGKL